MAVIDMLHDVMLTQETIIGQLDAIPGGRAGKWKCPKCNSVTYRKSRGHTNRNYTERKKTCTHCGAEYTFREYRMEEVN